MNPHIPHVTFVTEQHLGHETFALNLRAVVDADARLRATWVPVRYERRGLLDRVPGIPAAIAGSLRGRREVRAGWPDSTEVTFFNTQVPALIGGRRPRSRPFVLCTDITPVQYDAMAQHYGHRPDGRGPYARWKAWQNRRVFEAASKVIGWSEWTATSFVTDYGVRPDRVAVIPPGVDLARWQPASRSDRPDGPLRVLFVGGDFARKGGALLLAATERLPAGTVELVVVTRSELAERPGLVVHRGLQPNDPALVELYRTSDVFALPSMAEAFGIAAVEASATGLPVIAARVGGLADIVADGETGVLVRPGDVDDLAEALRRLAADPALRARMGAAGAARARERFDARRNAETIVEALLDCAVPAAGRAS